MDTNKVESWMPSVGEIDRAVGSYIPADRVAAIRTLIRAAVEKALAEQEARHKREVIEARIDTLTAHGDCVCPIYSVYGERLSAVDPECVVCSALKRLESELAALEETP